MAKKKVVQLNGKPKRSADPNVLADQMIGETTEKQDGTAEHMPFTESAPAQT